MQSSNLLPALRELPSDESDQHRSFRDHITGIVNMDRAMYAAEFASAASFGMWRVFVDDVSRTNTILGTNFPETEINDSYLQAAYERTDVFDPDMNVVEYWRDAMAEGSTDTLNELGWKMKGVVAEFQARDQLNEIGYDLELADNPYQQGWDLRGTDPNGEYVEIQVKAGLSDRQYDRTLEAMQESDYPFITSSDLHDRISEDAPELADRIIADVGPDYELVEGIEDGLATLSGNMGIDVPDGIVDIVPYAGAIFAGARLIYSVIKTEREFKAADRTTKNKIQVVQSLQVMSRLGISVTMAAVGGTAGTAAGSFLPGLGNLIGGIGGSLAGAGMGMYLNRHLKPHMLNLALNITGLTNDDLFYYKNRPRIDELAATFRRTSRELTAAPTASWPQIPAVTG